MESIVDGKPVNYAISYLLPQGQGEQFYVVKRPSSDKNLPNAWGLPAGSVTPGEPFTEAVYRSGEEKLGVELGNLTFLERGVTEREEEVLVMELYEADIAEGTPQIGQPYPEVTQYEELQWGGPARLVPAAEEGSLCCQLALNHFNINW